MTNFEFARNVHVHLPENTWVARKEILDDYHMYNKFDYSGVLSRAEEDSYMGPSSPAVENLFRNFQ